MITKAFAIYDSKGLMYGVPFFMPQTGMAIRAFTDLVNDGQSSVSRHPTDYVLYEIGSYDDSTGTFQSFSPQVMLGHAGDFQTVAKPPIVYSPELPAENKES